MVGGYIVLNRRMYEAVVMATSSPTKVVGIYKYFKNVVETGKPVVSVKFEMADGLASSPSNVALLQEDSDTITYNDLLGNLAVIKSDDTVYK